MKTIYLKRGLWLAAILLTSLFAGAQTKIAPKTAYDSESDNMYYRTYTDGGHKIVQVKTEFDDKIYVANMEIATIYREYHMNTRSYRDSRIRTYDHLSPRQVR